MAVTSVPGASLDSPADLISWLAAELVSTYQFTEYQTNGSIGTNSINYILERAQATTFHDDAPMTLMLTNITTPDDDGAAISGLQFNMAGFTAESFLRVVIPQSVTVDWVNDGGSQEIRITSGDFSSWSAAGYSVGDRVVVSGAATGSNDGEYIIASLSTTTIAGDSLEIQEIANGGIKDLTAGDTSDAITVEGRENVSALNEQIGGFMNAPRSDDQWENSGMSQMSATPPYVSAQLLTSDDANSATPTEPIHFILIVEVSSGIYRKMSFGEVVKLVPYVGGHYFSGDTFDPTNDAFVNAASNSLWLQGPLTESYSVGTSGGNPGGLFAEDYHSGGAPADGNGRGWMRFGGHGLASFDAPTHYCASPFPHMAGSGAELLAYSPSPFSGQSEAWPITIFGTYNTAGYTAAAPEHAPMAIIPDVFIADITNLDAGTVFTDSVGDKFLVIPMYTKAGSGVGSSEKWGYLIRNSALT